MSGLDPHHLRDLAVEPALRHIGAWSLAAEQLVMGTAAVESGLRSLRQDPHGPGLGLWQMEPNTSDDIWSNYLRFRQGLRERICGLVAAWPLGPEQLATNNAYAAAMCRVQYLRDPHSLPAAGDLDGLAMTWKGAYNTARGKGTTEMFLRAWHLVEGLYR